jgi:hypothetical protein
MSARKSCVVLESGVVFKVQANTDVLEKDALPLSSVESRI